MCLLEKLTFALLTLSLNIFCKTCTTDCREIAVNKLLSKKIGAICYLKTGDFKNLSRHASAQIMSQINSIFVTRPVII